LKAQSVYGFYEQATEAMLSTKPLEDYYVREKKAVKKKPFLSVFVSVAM